MKTKSGIDNLTPSQKKVVKEGLKHFSDSESIRLLFSLCRYRPECDKRIKNCVDYFKNARALLAASDQELGHLCVCPRGLFALKLFRELPAMLLKQDLMKRSIYKSSKEVFDYLYYSMRDLKNEIFKVLYLNQRSQIVDIVDLFEGGNNSIPINPREIVENAISHHAGGIIFIHNHPSGDPTPSKTDRQLTKDLVFVGMILQLHVLDHIIIGENSYFSFADDGLIQKYHDSFINLKIKGMLHSGPIYQHYNTLPTSLHFRHKVNATVSTIGHFKV